MRRQQSVPPWSSGGIDQRREPSAASSRRRIRERRRAIHTWPADSFGPPTNWIGIGPTHLLVGSRLLSTSRPAHQATNGMAVLPVPSPETESGVVLFWSLPSVVLAGVPPRRRPQPAANGLHHSTKVLVAAPVPPPRAARRIASTNRSARRGRRGHHGEAAVRGDSNAASSDCTSPSSVAFIRYP
jgi:hypothetical protein